MQDDDDQRHDQRHQRCSSGPGGAHIGWSMFGSRGPLLNVAESGGGGGGGGAGAGGAGGGSQLGSQLPAATAAPAVPATPPPVVTPAIPGTPEEIRAAEQRGHDRAYADLRRQGALKKKAVAAMDGLPATAASGVAGAAGAAQGDPAMRLRTLDRAVRTLALDLNEQQWERAQRDFLAERPGDATGWLRDYFRIATNTTTITNPALPVLPTNSHPASGAAGAPARGALPLDQMNVLDMTPEQVGLHVARVGAVRFKAQYADALRSVRIKVTPD